MTFSGAVLDRTTAGPVEGATVTVHRTGRANGRNPHIFPDTEHITDRAGGFTFEVPAEQVQAAIYIELDVRHLNYASRNGHGYGLSLIRRDLELGNQPWFKRIELLPGEEVGGVIADHDGTPLAGVPIKYYSVGGPLDRRFVSDQVAIGHTQTDAAGRFRFNAIRGSQINDFWAEPLDRAMLHHSVRDQRGDLGTFRLEAGVKVNGTVLDIAGQPVAHAALNLESLERHEVMWGISHRDTTSDAAGRFEFAPVKPGAYELKVRDIDRTAASVAGQTTPRLPGAFVPLRLTVEYLDYNRFPAIEIRAVPHVTIRLQYLDSQGRPTRGHAVQIAGKYNGQAQFIHGQVDAHGLIEVLVPRGLTDAEVLAGTDTFSALRFRRGPGGDLLDAGDISLGTLDDDVTDLFLVRFVAPALIVRAVDAKGQPAGEDWRPRVDYVVGAVSPKPPGLTWRDGLQGDVYFHRQDDGSWRSSQLLPDVEFTVSAEAPGVGRAAPQTLRLTEGEVREVTLTLS
jgi:protocatechuate 3,4-dioxygenase beta subunit